MRRAALLLLASCGCSTYGWADRPGPGRVTRPVAVRTIDVDAHAGADAATLTRELVEELHRAGVTQAAWTGANQKRDVVSCDIALVDDAGFGDHTLVGVSTRCEVDGTVVTTRRADAQLALRPEDRTLGRRRAADMAARNSLAPVAADLANYLAGTM